MTEQKEKKRKRANKKRGRDFSAYQKNNRTHGDNISAEVSPVVVLVCFSFSVMVFFFLPFLFVYIKRRRNLERSEPVE